MINIVMAMIFRSIHVEVMSSLRAILFTPRAWGVPQELDFLYAIDSIK